MSDGFTIDVGNLLPAFNFINALTLDFTNSNFENDENNNSIDDSHTEYLPDFLNYLKLIGNKLFVDFLVINIPIRPIILDLEFYLLNHYVTSNDIA